MSMEESRNLSCLNSEYEGAEDVILDLDMFYDILGEDSDPSQKHPEEFPNNGSAELFTSEAGNHYNFVQQSGISNPGTRALDGLFDSAVHPFPSIECGKWKQGCSLGYDSNDGSKNWLSLVHRDDAVDSERSGLSHCQMPISCISLEPRCSDADARHMPCFIDKLDISDGLKQVEGNNDHNSSSQTSFTGIDERFGNSGALDKKSVIETSGQEENSSISCLQMSFMDASGSSHMATSYDSGICLDSNVISDCAVCHSPIHYSNDVGHRQFAPGPSFGYFPCFNSQLLSYSDKENTTDVEEELFADTACETNINTGVSKNKYFPPGTEFSSIHNSNAKVWKISYQDGQYLSVNSGDSSYDAGEGDYILEERKPVLPFPFAHLNCSMEQVLPGSDEQKDDEFGPSYQNYCIQLNPNANQKPTQLSGCSPYAQYGNSIDQCAMLSGITYNWNLQPPACQISVPSEKQLSCLHSERAVKIIQNEVSGSHFPKLGCASIHGKSSMVDDDDDLCIIEAISHPAPTNRSKPPYMSVNTSQCNAYGRCPPLSVEGARIAANNEQHILQVALQDLSQPKSEIYPPEGVMAVPLLRHQRIALSWMVQKETAGLCCSGGILADDQGLGKTVSTIALILKERPPPAKCSNIVEKFGSETFDLDEDDVINPANCKKEVKLTDAFKQISVKDIFSSAQAKSRPSAGTLIVCPTSVLRQWADELHNKVTKETNLSVLVYHGNRTKDPYELAKYDVVITTYSIVSMEVPKQPLVNRDGEGLVNYYEHAVPPTEFQSSKKRKNHPSSNKKSSKKVEAALLESIAGPLAKVAWFRVVLDEAQSIKNHRTQVARACWGLRAKRRWCLSGTPIQNAIDDLYSYFRFLRYDPYAVYKSFCSTIKFPISRSPTRGYRKLQAVLKTIMLRRTKGTILDGQPIISLPPKFVELRRVEFSDEERDFYSRLEAESRAQFKEYADAGTVKQNYVNILLMLLRLRQACDHPLLVNYDSNSLGKNSVKMAKKLPREKQECLLNCLEASLALCTICNDSPEDAVVSICGHVFCNQCICEHLTGDENQCPTAKCKVQLTKSSVFSKATLSDCLSDQTSSSPGSCSEVIDEVDLCSMSLPTDSSKIKAALEFLLTLFKPQDSTLSDVSTGSSCTTIRDFPVDLSNNHSRSPLKDCPQSRSTSMNEKLNTTITVTGGKAIVFSQWTRMLDLFESALKNSSIQYRRLDGTMSVVSRDKAVKEFNSLPEVSVMIMSLKAASLGLNMVAACNVLMLDLWWNPTTEDQAIDRAHRIGQTRPVTVLRLTVRDTVEDRILALQQKKRAMVASAFGEDGAEGRQTRLTVKDLEYLFMV